ncbi:MAG: DUF3108 domain-containing protein [Pseudomonadota bacterium]
MVDSFACKILLPRRRLVIAGSIIGALMLGSAVTLAPVPASAQSVDVEMNYAATLNGIRIATGETRTRVSRSGNYTVAGHTGVRGLIGSLIRFDAWAETDGRLRNGRVRPDDYSARSEGNGPDRTMSISFADNRANRARMTPPLADNHFDSHVRIRRGHRRNVIDPISVLLIPAPDGLTREVCEQTIRVYTGRQRVNVRLGLVSVRDIRTSRADEYSGRVLVCSVKLRPISGHREGGRFQQFAADSDEIEVWIGHVDGTGFAFPYRVSVPTPVGTAVVHMTGLKVHSQSARAE